MFSLITRFTRSRWYYPVLSLLIAPVYALQWWLAACLSPYATPPEPLAILISFLVLGFPAIVCCIVHLKIRHSALLSIGSLWVCLVLPFLAGILTTFAYIKYGTAHSGSMAGLIVVIAAIANLTFSITLITLCACKRALIK